MDCTVLSCENRCVVRFPAPLLPSNADAVGFAAPHLKKIRYFCRHCFPVLSHSNHVSHCSNRRCSPTPPHVEPPPVAARPAACRSVGSGTNGGRARFRPAAPLRTTGRHRRGGTRLWHLRLVPHGGTLCPPRFALLLSRDSPQKCLEHFAGGERFVDRRVARNAHRWGLFRPGRVGQAHGH